MLATEGLLGRRGCTQSSPILPLSNTTCKLLHRPLPPFIMYFHNLAPQHSLMLLESHCGRLSRWSWMKTTDELHHRQPLAEDEDLLQDSAARVRERDLHQYPCVRFLYVSWARVPYATQNTHQIIPAPNSATVSTQR